MLLAHFRLTLSAPARSLLRLLQINEYGWHVSRASDDTVRVPAELAAALESLAPGSQAAKVYADLFGSEAPRWHFSPTSGTEATIETVPGGADPLILLRAIAIAAPEAFAGDMAYVAMEPVTLN